MRITLLLMAAYLVLMATLATQIDRRFFVNDGLAIAIFTLLLAAIVMTTRTVTRRHR